MNAMTKPFLIFTLVSMPIAMTAETFEVSSPSGGICVTVTADEEGRPLYEVSRNGAKLVEPSALGMTVGTVALDRFTRSIEPSYNTIDETFAIPHGKVSSRRNHCNELKLDCKGQGGRNLEIYFRVYDDAVAFRYGINNRNRVRLSGESTEFNFSSIEKTWAMTYRKDYSWYYDGRDWDALTDEVGYSTPMLIKTADSYVLLTEAANESSMAASRLIKGDQNRQLKLAHNATGNIISDSFLSPWRTMIIGDIAEVVESATIAALGRETSMTDTSWIKPGRVSWNWGAEDGDSQPTLEQAKAYIDLAAYYGWEYFLLDDGWEGRIDPAEVAAYAEEKGVGLFLWVHQSRFSADVNNNLQWFSKWAEAGVKGVKIDFFEDDSREMLAKYEGILEAAAQTRLLVNFHGCIKPSGLERTWPHLMTSEAVLGGEFYMFNSTMTPASHGINLALTRNVLGAMDYTPVKYGNKRGRVIKNTTWAYQTALATAFESSLLCLCDCPANLTGNIAEPLLRNIPTTWDEIKCLEATPDETVTLARRKGDDWWIATLTSKERTAAVDLSFLPEGETYGAYIYTEGIHRTDIAFEYREDITRNSVIDLKLGENSGATIIVTKEKLMDAPTVIRREAEAYNMRGTRKVDADCSGGQFIGELNNAKKYLNFDDIEVEKEGDYYLTIFYLDNEEHTAYIEVNGGEKEYHAFNRPGGTISGRDMAFKTIKVHLSAGVNKIVYGNENGLAPAVDRITVTSFDKPETASAEEITADNLFDASWRFIAGGIEIDLPADATVSVIAFDGRLLSSRSFKAGKAALELPAGANVIVNVVCGSLSQSFKIASCN